MNTTTPFTSPKYRPDIDGLRAMAVLSVVAFHAFPAWIRGGFIGVDIFFVISGFLISTIIFENLEKGTFSFREFYARRIKRIFPALILVLTACFVFGWFTLLADEYQQLGKHMAAGAGFISNFVLWSEVGYFDNSADTKPLLHLWSLGIEEQFYMLWPLVIWAAWKKKFNLLSIAILFFIVSFVLNIKGVKNDPTTTFYLPHTRFWELLAGSILAWFHVYRQKPPSAITLKLDRFLATILYRHPVNSDGATLSNLFSFLGFSLLLFGFWRIHQDIGFPGKWALVPVLGAVLTILAGAQAWINRAILSNKLVVWFGLISFPLYLWHWPLLSFARIIEGETPSRTTRIIAVLIAIALAWFTYRFVERNIRYRGRGKTQIVLLVFFISTIGYIGYNTYSRGGLKFRTVVKQQSLNSLAFSWPDEKNQTKLCINTIAPRTFQYCVISDKHPVQVALIGDSHANAIFDFTNEYFGKRGIGVIQLGRGGCSPFPNSGGDICSVVMDDILTYIEQNENITKVIITAKFAARLTGYNFGEPSPYSESLINVKNRADFFESRLRVTSERLRKAKKMITIVLDLPELNFDPRSCLNRWSIKNCQIEKKIVDERQAGYREIIRRVAPSYDITLVDLMEPFCDNLFCYISNNGKILYRDSHHLGILGSDFLKSRDFRLD